jgi:hypothetical protein
LEVIDPDQRIRIFQNPSIPIERKFASLDWGLRSITLSGVLDIAYFRFDRRAGNDESSGFKPSANSFVRNLCFGARLSLAEREQWRTRCVVATLLAVAFAGSSAFVQGNYHHHKWCLVSETGRDCAYDTLAQCKASKTGNTDRCSRNGPARNH